MHSFLKSPFAKGRLWLCLPVAIACVIDVIASMLGQSPAYWAGAYIEANELNPLGRWFLSIHPLAFIAYNLGVIVLLTLTVLIVPNMPAKIIATSFVIFRAAGVEDWLNNVLHVDPIITDLLLIFIAVIFTYAFTQSENLIRQSRKITKKDARKK
jgi:hypothetical protein